MECRGSHKDKPKVDDCEPVEYDAGGWPLGFTCFLCGAWICGIKDHSKRFKIGKHLKIICRKCSVQPVK